MSTAESKDKGHLLVPLLEVERNAKNRSTRVTFEIPDIAMMGSMEEFDGWLREELARVHNVFVHAWGRFKR